ncbi:MAG: transcription termination factor NusA [Gemmatimonadetes bacterium]|nr:transcription termination factor NusA [Gemmatimonadota bacterium]
MATPADVLAALRELANAKQLDSNELIDLLRDGIQAAMARRYGPTVNAEIQIDEVNGVISVTRLRTVVETVEDSATQISLEEARWEDPEFQPGEVLEEEEPFEAFGRSAVQAAKQRIIQRVREGERSRIREEFANQVGQLLSGEIQQIERGKLVILINQFREAEAIIPYREQNRREHFHQGDSIRAVLTRLEETPRGPRLILSRADASFVSALFGLEVPEIQQGIVEIRAAAREVGNRTKVAVVSSDDSIDPVGACVGLKGSRVQAVVNELGGERIDIVPWSPDPERFARMSLAPARVSRVYFDSDTGTIQAIVDDDQLSLAIGKHGQNVRLASELTGWKIDLYSSREWQDRTEEGPLFAPLQPTEDLVADVKLQELRGFPEDLVQTLEKAGYHTLRDILDLEHADVMKIEGMDTEQSDVLLSFLSEVTEETTADDESPVKEASDDAEGSDLASDSAGDEAETGEPAAPTAAVAEQAEPEEPSLQTESTASDTEQEPTQTT